MVVKMMKWRPWPPLSSKKFEAKIVIRRLQGLHYEGLDEDFAKLAVEVNWKGSKANALSPFRRTVRRNFTKEEILRKDCDGVVEWNEEFFTVCNFSALKEGLFHPWEVAFTVFNGLNQVPKSKVPAFATALLNLVEFASTAEQKEIDISLPLSMPSGSMDCRPSLCVSLSLLELRIAQEPSQPVQRSVLPLPMSPRNGKALIAEKDELSGLKAGLRKVKILKGLSAHRVKKACREEEGSDGRSSVRSEDTDYNYPFDTDSLEDQDEGDLEEGRDDPNVLKSVSYGTLAYANHAGGLFYSNTSSSEENDRLYYSNSKTNVEDSNASVLDSLSSQSSKRSIFPWRKRKLSFRSPKAKGEPLLKKYFGEEGGDDIDFDRRQLSSSDESIYGLKSEEDSVTNRSSVSEFGDDNFAVGSWEQKEVTSRDGHMKIHTKVFFASIDQRSERAAGESACTALVAVIADWFQNNRNEMPIKSQLDSLIREGSLEWRNLCERESYKERFPDKHFDLETVLEAKIRPLSVVSEKSFIGFFHPDGLEGGGFGFLNDAMSFDSIWDEITQIGLKNPINVDPLVYIVSWNDHFFILKIEHDAYYIIDTLGERLYEGCNQAYVLKFDKETTIRRPLNQAPPSDQKKSSSDKVDSGETTDKLTEETAIVSTNKLENCEEEVLVVCRGKESCKEYIKSFLAAIPIRELQTDLKKGLKASVPLHHRLQIEFHYTECLQPAHELALVEVIADSPATSVSTHADYSSYDLVVV